MTVSTRRDILVALKTGFESITLANGFQSEVAEVKRGQYHFIDFSIRPAISYTNYEIPNTEYTSAHEEKALKIMIWGYVDVDGTGQAVDNLDALIADVHKMLASSIYNPYAVDTHEKNIFPYEGGVQYNFGMFEMEIEINFEHVRGTL
jgi:hypothetical protein